MADELQPPHKSPTANDTERVQSETSSEDHFSDAPEIKSPTSQGSSSPVPITRVERVDDQPSHGEVPGTDAYELRTQDAVPDEVEIVPEGQRSRSISRARADSRPLTPGGTPVPKMIVEKVDPDQPSHGDVPGTAAFEMRKADAEPDEVLKAPEGSPTASGNRSPTDDSEIVAADDTAELASEKGLGDVSGSDAVQPQDEEADGFGDDFDEFEEGGEDDFGDFDDGFQEAGNETNISSQDTVPDSMPHTPIPSLPSLHIPEAQTYENLLQAVQAQTHELFPDALSHDTSKQWPETKSAFLSDRSVSLWSQLAAPPPLQPPNWVRSRIRRLFLVSLGVPVDLDEILPASKQKKLVLPSIVIPGERSPGPGSPERANGAMGRVKKGNNSTTSVDSSNSKAERRRRGRSPVPELNINSTTMLCSTTDTAMKNFTDDELTNHVRRLKELEIRANELLAYWTKKKDSALGDKEAFEGVIENLVKHAKKVRK